MSAKPQQANAEPVPRANEPGLYECHCCGETLSGPDWLYVCPQCVPVESLGREA